MKQIDDWDLNDVSFHIQVISLKGVWLMIEGMVMTEDKKMLAGRMGIDV